MAQREFSRSAKSPRYSTTKALGFGGGSRDAAGNIAPPTATNIAGPADRSFIPSGQPATQSQSAAGQPAIADFSATAPRPPSFGRQLTNTVGNQLLQTGAKKVLNTAVDTIGKEIRNQTAGPDAGGDPLPSSKEYPVSQEDYQGANEAYTAGAGVGADAVTYADPIFDNPYSNDITAIGADGAGLDAYGGISGDVGVASEVAGNVGDIATAGEAAGGAADLASGASYVPGWGWIVTAARLAKGVVADSEPGSVGGVVDTLLLPSHEQWLDDPGASFVSSADPIGQAARDVFGFESPNLDNCFITEAVMSQQGMNDNSEPLMVLRAFRDNIMMQSPEGQAMVQEYDQIAPQVVEAIGQHENAMQIFQQIYSEFIVPAVEAVKAGEYKGALEIYAKMVAFASAFSEEVMQGDEEAMAGISDLGDHAAMVGQDDDATAMIGGQGVGDADWSQNSQFVPGMGAGPQQPAQTPAIAQMGIPPRRY
jgi:hypothetical protein